MTKYQRKILKLFRPCLAKKEFQLASHLVDYLHAAEICELQGRHFKLRCITHRSESVIEISPGTEKDKWLPFHLVKYALTKDPRSRGDTNSENAVFLANHVQDIAALIKKKNLPKKLSQIAKEFQLANGMWLKKDKTSK